MCNKNIIKHEFYVLSWYVHGRIVFLTWLPASANMSEDDFMEHVNVLNNLIDTNYTRILFIDAIEFKTKIEKSLIKELQYIKEKSSLKWIVYASSGRSMKKLLKKIKSESITISEHATRNDLLQVYRETTEE